MANVPTVTGPSVSQSSAPSGISAPSGAFGAGVLGAGLKEVGAATEQAAGVLEAHVLQFQAINNKASADQASFSAAEATQNWEREQQSNNRTAYAQDPVGAAKAAGEHIEAIRAEHRSSLTSPAAQAIYDSDSRRFAFGALSRMSSFAGEANRAWVLQTQQGMQKQALDEIVGDPSLVDDHSPSSPWARFMAAQATIDEKLGTPPELAAANAKELAGKAIGYIADTMAAGGDINSAHAFVEAHKDAMGPTEYRNATVRLGPAILANDAARVGDDAVRGVIGDGTTSGGGSAVSPVPAGSPITGRFGDARAATASTPAHIHAGTDYGVPLNTPISSMRPGTVVSVGPQGGYGLAVVVDEGGGRTRLYGHLRASGLRPGDAIQAGGQIGESGQSGNATGPSVHVELRQNGHAIDMNSEGSVASAAGGPMTSTQLESQRAAILSRVDANAEALHPGNYQFKLQAEGRAEAVLNRQIGAVRGTEDQSAALLYQSVLANDIQDRDTLFRAVPGAQAAYNSLPHSAQVSLDAALRTNRNELTPVRAEALETINGMAAQAQAGINDRFLQTDLNSPTLDLRLDDRIKYLKLQEDLRAKRVHATQSEHTLLHFMGGTQFGTLLRQGGISTGTQQYDIFVGAMRDEISNFESTHANRPPDDKEGAALMARAFSRTARPWTGTGLFNSGSRGTEGVDPADITAARSYLAQLGQVSPTDQQIGEAIAALYRKQEASRAAH